MKVCQGTTSLLTTSHYSLSVVIYDQPRSKSDGIQKFRRYHALTKKFSNGKELRIVDHDGHEFEKIKIN